MNREKELAEKGAERVIELMRKAGEWMRSNADRHDQPAPADSGERSSNMDSLPPTPTPTIGRIVHYTNLGDRDGRYPPEVQAALITGINADGTVALHIFYKTGQFDMPSVPYTVLPAGSDGARGSWTYPARV